jgi:light-regulated signal transduction histidine kinase (bacteriophytochrome)
MMLIKKYKKYAIKKTITKNKYIVKKHEKIDKKSIPLSNMTTEEAILQTNEYSAIKTFNPMENFLLSTKNFIEKSAKKKIDFNYFIDPTIPTLCIGEGEKINKALDYLVNYAIATSKSRGTIKFNIENIASTKFESAIRFSVEDEHSHFTKEEKKQILNIMLKSDNKVNFNDIRDDLIYINELVHSIGGTLKIENKTPKGAIFYITINFNIANNKL